MNISYITVEDRATRSLLYDNKDYVLDELASDESVDVTLISYNEDALIFKLEYDLENEEDLKSAVSCLVYVLLGIGLDNFALSISNSVTN